MTWLLSKTELHIAVHTCGQQFTDTDKARLGDRMTKHERNCDQ